MGYSPWGHKESDTTERLSFFRLSFCLGTPGALVGLQLSRPSLPAAGPV